MKTAPSQQDRLRSHKSAIYPRIVTTLQHVLSLTETKGSCVHMLLITTWLLDKSTGINCSSANWRNPCQVTRKVNCKWLVRRLDGLHSETLYWSNLTCLTSVVCQRLSEAHLCTCINMRAYWKISRVSARDTRASVKFELSYTVCR